MKPQVAVFASGNGSNFEALAKACESGKVKAEIAVCITDKPGAYTVTRARNLGIPAVEFRPKDFATKADYERAVLETLQQYQVEFICLAGYMRLIGDVLLQAFGGRIINIHPSLLPSFKGAHGIKDAFDYGVRITGVTVHYVDESLDGGKILAQDCVRNTLNDTLETLEEKIHACEHKLYPRALQMALNNLKKHQPLRKDIRKNKI